MLRWQDQDRLARRLGWEGPAARGVVRLLCGPLRRGHRRARGALDRWSAGLDRWGDAASPGRRGGRGPASLRRLAGIADEGLDPAALRFAAQTYQALALKILARASLESASGDVHGPSRWATSAAALDRSRLTATLGALESGEAFSSFGVQNFPDDGVLDWYLRFMDEPLAGAIRLLLNEAALLLSPADGACCGGPEAPACGAVADALGKLHHALLPAGLRHGQGEFYTPAWLARHLLDSLWEGEDPLPGPGPSPPWLLLDPACGAGVFLLLALEVLRGRCAGAGLARGETLDAVLASVAGVDLDPLAVMTARTGLLLALSDLLPHRRGPVRLPVWRGDSVLGRLDRDPAGLATGQFHFVAGNPPWIAWETLPRAYRAAIAPLWHRYGLHAHSGMDTILGKGKKDLAMLMAWSVADRWLREGGRLAFAVTRTLWKTAGAGQGFRRLRLGPEGPHMRVLRVEDLEEIAIFDARAARASLMLLQKGSRTRYPVPYVYWQRPPGGRGEPAPSSGGPPAGVRRIPMVAEPVCPGDPTSPWITATPEVLGVVRRVQGSSPYRARAGVCTWANGVFWLEVEAESPDGLLRVRNIVHRARTLTAQRSALLEPDLVYPLLRGRDISRWRAASTCKLLLAQDPVARKGWPPERLRRDLPYTWDYLQSAEAVLRARAGFRRYFTRTDAAGEVHESGPFYSMFNVNLETLSPWKVVWREQSSRLTPAAVGPASPGEKPVLPDHKLMMVACSGPQEAHYLCAALGSSPAALAVRAYALPTQQSTHLLDNLNIPLYRADSELHQELAELSSRAHRAAGRAGWPGSAASRELEQRVDLAAARLWSLTARDMELVRAALEEPVT